MSDNIPAGQVVQGRNMSEVETILGFLGASPDWYRFFELAGERGCGRTTRDPAMAWLLPSDFLEEPITEDRMKEMTFMRMAEDGAMTMVTFAMNPDMGCGRLVKVSGQPMGILPGFMPSVPDSVAICLDWMFYAHVIAERHNIDNYTVLNAHVGRERYNGTVAVGNREDGPEYCCRLGQSVAQAQEQSVVAPEVRMVPDREGCGDVQRMVEDAGSDDEFEDDCGLFSED